MEGAVAFPASFRRISIIFITAIFLTVSQVWSADAGASQSLVQGLEAYRAGDYVSSSIFLRKAVSDKSNYSAENYYMLIMSQMLSKNYTNAVNDCSVFAVDFEDSPLAPYVQFQMGKAYFYLDQKDSCVFTLSDFCHQNPQSELYPTAVFYIAECFYEDYSYDEAREFYSLIVEKYPDDPHAGEAQFKIESIEQKDREQKLLYLLKVTGEEYLSAKENYERQLKQYQTEDLLDLRRQLSEANERIAELEKAASDSYAQAELAKEALAANEQHQRELEEEEKRQREQEISALREKANQIETILDFLGTGSGK